MKPFLFLVSFLATAQAYTQSKQIKFSHTEKTIASPEALWALWTDVPNWKQWDKGIRSATISTVFSEGAKGKLVPDKGPKTRFVIRHVVPGQSYHLYTSIPFGKLIVRRSMKQTDEGILFTHEVEFTGLLKQFFAKKFGSRYKAMLPEVMKEIKRIAEEKTES